VRFADHVAQRARQRVAIAGPDTTGRYANQIVVGRLVQVWHVVAQIAPRIAARFGGVLLQGGDDRRIDRVYRLCHPWRCPVWHCLLASSGLWFRRDTANK